MAEFLVLRLDGPLMCFGDVAIDETRPTAELPSQSMLTGLLANALGWRSTHGDRLNRLQERLVYGARRDRMGERLVDYQNAHIAPKQAAWRWRTPGPLERAGGGSENIQRWRYYIADGCVSVVLTLLPEDESPTLDDLSKALQHPARPLFLGRVSCPPAGFLHDGERVRADDVRAALELTPPLQRRFLERRTESDGWAQWPADGSLGDADGTMVSERFDMRDWIDDLHVGSRLVSGGRIRPAAIQKTEG